jgi:hypothetical protein
MSIQAMFPTAALSMAATSATFASARERTVRVHSAGSAIITAAHDI